MTIKYIDLFSGIGGFHIALDRIKHTNCVFASEIDKNAQSVYELNFGMKPHGDITKIKPKDIPNHDLLVGGFPCQSFSVSGKKLGLNDNRGTLFDNIIDILKTKKPKFSILENVKNIKTIDNSNVYKYIYEKLNKIGYNVFDIMLNPVYFGIPQNRERIFFIIIRKDLSFNKNDIINDILKSKVKQHNILSKNVPSQYNISSELNKIFTIWNEFLRNIKPQKIGFPITIKYFKNDDNTSNKLIIKNNLLYKNNKIFIDKWLTKYEYILNKKVIYGILEWQTGVTLSNKVSIFDYIVQIRQSGIRVKRKDVFPTLVAIVQTPIINKRYLTPRECARLQSFPEDYKFIDNDFITLKQLGNSVNVDVVYIVCKNVLNKFI